MCQGPHAGRCRRDPRLDGHRVRRDRPMSARDADDADAAGELRLHAREPGAGEDASSPSTRRAGRRARCCRCSIWRSASTAAGCRARRWTTSPGCSRWRRSASTRSRPSTRCSTCSRSAAISCRSARTTPCWLRGSDEVVGGLQAQARHRPRRDAPPTACSRWARSSAWAPASTRRCCRSTTTSTRTSMPKTLEAVLDALARGEKPKTGLADRAPGLGAGGRAARRCWRGAGE